MTGSFSLNDAGTFLRTGLQEKEDVALAISNIQAESWKNWPNEAGVRQGPIPRYFAIRNIMTDFIPSSTA